MSAPVQVPRDAPRVPPLAAFIEGWRRVLTAPLVVLGATAAWWLPFEMGPDASVRVGRIALTNDWAYFLSEQIRELTQWFAPELQVVYQGPWSLSQTVFAVAGLHSVIWTFVVGGALDRLARGRPVSPAAFFSACGGYFFRLFRLTIAIALLSLLLGAVRQFSGGSYVDALVALAVFLGVVVLDFARARAVVEDRSSMIGAVAASIRFIRRRFWRVAGLTLLNALSVLVVLRLQIQIASTMSEPPPWMFPVLLCVGVAVRLATLSSQLVFFQGELAHAGYTAAPLPVWPDSPAVEAMDNLQRQHRLDDRPR